MELERLKSFMHGIEDGFDDRITVQTFLDVFNIFHSIIPFLKNSDIQFEAVESRFQLDLNVGERKAVIEEYLFNPQLAGMFSKNFVDLSKIFINFNGF